MKLGILAGYSGRKFSISIDAIKHAENLGYESIWTAEAYGSDAVTPAAWILAQTDRIKVGTAIMQMPARSPAMAAMTAMSLAELSGGRFIAGLGASGPQVVEGWHGVPYGKPVSRLREYVQIMKQIFARQAPLSFEGSMYNLPYTGAGATGLGKPLKSILHCEEDIPFGWIRTNIPYLPTPSRRVLRWRTLISVKKPRRKISLNSISRPSLRLLWAMTLSSAEYLCAA